MGNIDSLRDWGHAKDYVRMQWMMLQQEAPDDFVIATGKQYSVREFITWSAAELGISLRFEGRGVDEVAVVAAIEGDKAPALTPGDVVLRIDPRYSARPRSRRCWAIRPRPRRTGWAPRSPRRNVRRDGGRGSRCGAARPDPGRSRIQRPDVAGGVRPMAGRAGCC